MSKIAVNYAERMSNIAVNYAERFLLFGKTWRYLRYLHLREYVAKVADDIQTICVCGSGHGMAELLIAIEFPHLTITLTDIVNREKGYPNYYRAMDVAWRQEIDNLRFSIWNVLVPTRRSFDLVASTEMLEHIENDRLAAENMRKAASKYVYCLVPYSDEERNANLAERERVLKSHEHFVCGYDAATLTKLFPGPIAISGAYWNDFGNKWRRAMEAMSKDEIENSLEELKTSASFDLIDRIPQKSGECLGIKIISKVQPSGGDDGDPAQVNVGVAQ